MSSSPEWCTIESDPGVFTELLEQLGVPQVEVDELWSMDDDSLGNLTDAGPVYGLLFLFKWKPGMSSKMPNRTPLEEVPSNMFFAHQTTTNACATQALLSIVLNSPNLKEVGKTLSEFKTFTTSFPPSLKGEAIGASKELQTVHNSFARRDLLFLQESSVKPAKVSEDVFHFVAYIPFEGKVYELDGLQSGPIEIGNVEDNKDWMTVARTAVQERMQALGEGEIKFNLMAVIRNVRVGLEEKLSKMDEKDKDQVEAQLAAEHAKRHAWTMENQRRRHNYVPLCIQLLKEIAKSGNMQELTTEAKERIRAKRVKAQESK